MPNTLSHGVLLDGEVAEMRPSAPSRCHANAAALYEQASDVRISIGYALSGVGLWP